MINYLDKDYDDVAPIDRLRLHLQHDLAEPDLEDVLGHADQMIDELARLRAEVARLTLTVEQKQRHAQERNETLNLNAWQAQKIARLEAEVKRLRAALEGGET